eukprot:6103670-Amphidinium_carterae.1
MKDVVAVLQQMLDTSAWPEESCRALQAMLTWKLPPVPLPVLSALFIFSFDATPLCRALRDCTRPGPTNELLAATAAEFYAKQGRNVHIFAQWE